MTKKVANTLVKYLGEEAGEGLYLYVSTATKHAKTKELLYPNWKEDILKVSVPRFHSPVPTNTDFIFDTSKVDRYVRFTRLCKHVKGDLAGERFDLLMWQIIFVVAPLFGWVKKTNGKRLYRTLFEETAKKSGKSTFAAALGLYLLMADGEKGAEVACGAGSRDQARKVFDVAQGMVKGSKVLSQRLKALQSRIRYDDTNSYFDVLSAEGGFAAGGNFHGAIIDELLEHKRRELVDNLENGTAARTNSLVAYLTTAGLDDSNSIYAEKRNMAEQIALGQVVNPSWLTAIWTLGDKDDWKNKKVWYKSNPSLGYTVTEEYLERRAIEAAASPTVLNKFLRDHMNVRTGQFTRWLDIDKWDRSGAQYPLPDSNTLKTKNAFAGLDLARTTDMAALSVMVPEVLVNPENGEEVETLCWFLWCWSPADTIEERARKDRAPYLQWVKDGWLTLTEGDVIDYDYIEQKAFDLADFFSIDAVRYDRWGAKQIEQHLNDGGLNVTPMGQGFASFSSPMKELERLILQRKIRHSNNPVLRYAAQSLAIKHDPAGNIKPDKGKSTGKIDSLVSGVMAIDAYQRFGDLGVSAYAEN